MKAQFALAAAAALTLAACGEETTSVDPTDTEAMAQLADEMVKPEAGEYEVATELVEFEVPGMPKDKVDMVRGTMAGGFAETSTYCLTEEQADKGFEESIREMQSADGECEYKKFAASGDTLDAEMACKGPDGSVANMAMTGSLGKTEQDITMTMNAQAPGMAEGEMKMKLRMKSKRVGACAA